MANASDKNNKINVARDPDSAEDEILVRDESGEFKILKGGQLISLGEDKSAAITVSGLIKGIVKESGLDFKEAVLKKRLEEAIIARLKDVRDSLETKSVLKNDIQKGGLGLEENQADKLIKIIENEFKKGEVIKLLETISAPPARPALEAPVPLPEPASLPPPPAKKQVFDFYPKDEEEIEKIKKEMAGIQPALINKIDEIIDSLIKKLNLSIADDSSTGLTASLLKSRFKSAVVSRLKDVRDTLETKDTLVRKKEEGGLGLGEAQAEEITKELNKLIGRAKAPATTRDIKALKGPREPVRLNLPLKAGSPVPALSNLKESKPSLPAPKFASQAPALDRPASPLPSPLPGVKKTIEEQARPRIVDVKFTPKIKMVGPADELAMLSLIDFRRLSKDPKTAIQKILDKISLLEEESFSGRIKGIRAFRASEAYKIYLEIGEESIIQNKPIKLIIQERQSQNKPTLTEAEFAALSELSKDLRF